MILKPKKNLTTTALKLTLLIPAIIFALVAIGDLSKSNEKIFLEKLAKLKDGEVISLEFVDFEGKEQKLVLEVALSPEKQAEGLMFRTEMGKIDGMLFIFPKENLLNFWMKNTLMPLDIIFLNSKFRVTSLHKNTKIKQIDETYSSILPAKMVIELNGNSPLSKHFKVGEQIDLKKIEILKDFL